ncbi:MAG: DsrE/DsrF/DrsH-like family protein [Anaerolineales bacterium]
MTRSDPDAPHRLSIIASKGTLDWAYPPMILASTAGAMGWEVGIFFTFFGLSLLLKDLETPVTPIGNPAMPMKMPFGPKAFQDVNWQIPTALMAVPGFDSLAQTLMKKGFKDKGVASLPDLRDACVAAEVDMIACMITCPVFGIELDDLIPEARPGGAATFLEWTVDADISLFI